MIRRFFKFILISTVVMIFVISSIIVSASFGLFGLFWERWTTALMGNPLDPDFSWYQPLERTQGNFLSPLEKISPEQSEIALEVFEEARQYAEIHGSKSLVIQHKGKIVFESYWQETEPDSLFGLHSFTKTMNALLVGHLIEDGFIGSIDDPVANYIEEWRNGDKTNITIKHLLHMSGGLKESFDYSPFSDRIQRAYGTDIVSANLNMDPEIKPGTVFSHNNYNSQILGILIQRTSGKRYSEYFSEKIWSPLGSRDAFFFVDRPDGMVHTDCCMWASIRDMIRIGQMLMNKGYFMDREVLPKKWVNQMITPSDSNRNYGMQIWLGNEYQERRAYDARLTMYANFHSEPYVADDLFFMDGIGKQRMYIIPSESLVILRTGDNSPEWDDSKLPNLILNALKE